MTEFKKGDRVKAISPCDGNDEFIGKLGNIVTCDVLDKAIPYKVRFDNIEGESKTWWCEKDSLELFKPEPLFKEGDRVRILIKHPNINKYNFGNIIHMSYSDMLSVLVEFDLPFAKGHDGNQVVTGVSGKDGHCWWFNLTDLEKVKSTDYGRPKDYYDKISKRELLKPIRSRRRSGTSANPKMESPLVFSKKYY